MHATIAKCPIHAGVGLGNAQMASAVVIESRALRRRTLSIRAAANLLSVSRVVLSTIWICAFVLDSRQWIVLGAIALCAALTDLVDGPVARLSGAPSPLGRWLDSFADVVFVLTVLTCEAAIGAIPVYIPILIGMSFTQYVLDSIVISRAAAPVKSRLGHWGGVVNYILVIALAFSCEFTSLVWLAFACAPALAIFYIAAMLERVIAYRAIWRRESQHSSVRDWRAEGTSARSARCKT